MKKNLLKNFNQPPASYRNAPFWAWNSTLDKNELKRQIDGEDGRFNSYYNGNYLKIEDGFHLVTDLLTFDLNDKKI